MLVELVVRDLGVIEEACLPLGPGMTALTGETGAGKTLLVGALALLLGGRADPSVVRPGAAEATVEARFVPGTAGDELVLARAVAARGRSRAWVDARGAPLSALVETGGALVELHGQHAHRALVEPAAQRRALDTFAGIDLRPLHRSRQALRQAEAALAGLGGDEAARARHADLLRFEIGEVEGAAIEDEHEDERLAEEEERLAEMAAHRDEAAGALRDLVGDDTAGGGASDAVGRARQRLAGRAAFEPVARRLAAVQVEMTDLAGELRQIVDGWEDDPVALQAVRARRHQLRELGRRFGGDLASVLARTEAARCELQALEDRETAAARAVTEIDQRRRALAAEEVAVAAARRAAAPALAQAVEHRLADLGMPRARLQVTVSGNGAAEDVEFQLGANPGEPLLPLAKVASGGELARTMLALRLVLSDAPPTMVFDEVDAGIGGEAALAVGRALAELSRHQQVLVVTHLAQVAAFADRHLSVRKAAVGGRTRSEVEEVVGSAREVELARMLSGQPGSEVARRHAAELLAGARRA